MADYITNTEELTSIANAIRSKTGKTASLEYPAEFVSEINSISGGMDGDNLAYGASLVGSAIVGGAVVS